MKKLKKTKTRGIHFGYSHSIMKTWEGQQQYFYDDITILRKWKKNKHNGISITLTDAPVDWSQFPWYHETP